MGVEVGGGVEEAVACFTVVVVIYEMGLEVPGVFEELVK